ncbi:MAG: hypothetical protein UHU19_12525, partial [Lachnospiraceae bacterium]|nr:hypothetical protein [Lachnospiraceae bacterium]
MKKWKKRGKQFATLLLATALIGNSVDLSVLTVRAAENQSVTTNQFNIDGGAPGTDYTLTTDASGNGTILTINTDKPLTISGGTETAPITGQIAVSAGVKANLTLNGLHLTGMGASFDENNVLSKDAVSAIDLTSTSELTLTLAENSTNTVTGGASSVSVAGCGIHVPEGTSLTIQGSGKLDVTGGRNAVGIGGTATSDPTENGESCGTVVITGGTVSVTGGFSAYGIGGGWSSTSQGLMGSVVITGGTVTVAGGTGNTTSIGGRVQTDSGVAIILAANANLSKTTSTANASSASIVPNNSSYELRGPLELLDVVSEYTIPANNTLTFVAQTNRSSTLTIPETVTLNIPEGVTLELASYYKDTLADHITNKGTVRIACNHSSYEEYAEAIGGKVEKLHDWSNKDGVCINCGAAHKHADNDWTYAKGTAENTIIATCGVCHKEALVTLTAPTDLTYDGTA